jgi:hypothetical protein
MLSFAVIPHVVTQLKLQAVIAKWIVFKIKQVLSHHSVSYNFVDDFIFHEEHFPPVTIIQCGY